VSVRGAGNDPARRVRAPDVVILDVMLPGLDGLSVLRQTRASRVDVAVLLLTAKDTLEDHVAGLDSGADDYLVKPVAFEELLARVRALVRRKYDKRDPVITVGDLVIDTAARTVRRGDQHLDLTAREYNLLELLPPDPGAARGCCA
jgi:DNA-binding response OmpR family regulator